MELIFGSACIRNNIFVGKWIGLYTVGDGEGGFKVGFYGMDFIQQGYIDMQVFPQKELM